MKKRFVIIPAIMAITCAILVTIALVSIFGANKYKIDTKDMELTIEYNGELDLNDITIYNKLLNKEVLVDESMIVSCSSTDTIGRKVVVIRYRKQEFTIYFNVKYKVEFVVDDEVISEQFVTTSDEIIVPQDIAKEGYEFVRWDKEIPDNIQDNIRLNALFSSTTLPIPPLGELTAKYGTPLSSILLPSNVNGEWKFVDENQLVGNVGKRQFAVKFVPATNQIVEKYDVVTINVTQKNLNFVILKDQFVYDGKPHFPIWELPEDVDVQILVGEPQTEASEVAYRYALNINDTNYKGFYSGLYYIQKPNIVVTVLDHSADYLQPVEMQYQVEGFDNDEILDISINVPSILNAGTYEVGAVVGNSNVNATINSGSLTVNKIDLNPLPINPTLSTSKVPAVYGDKLSTVGFENNFANGVWSWQNPDMLIDQIVDFKANAVFTPNSKNYNAHIREISVNNIDKKTLQISVTENEFTYNSYEHQLAYQIEDGSYQNIDVLGNIAEIGAGTYTKTLTISHEFYKGSRTAQLIINKANPETDFSNTYTKTWFAGIKLKDVKLNEGYTWVDENFALNEIGTHAHQAIFTPSDTDNYNAITGTFDITVNKTTASLHGVEGEYEFVYTGNVHKIAGIVPSHYESELQYSYKYMQQTTVSIINAGQYEVTIILPESKHYLEVSATTIVNVAKADIEVTLQSLTATYEDTLNDVKLPTDDAGSWSWVAPLFTFVGNVGERKHSVEFAPKNTNYNTVIIEATINVAPKQLTFNIVNNTFAYTGEPFDIEYTITDANSKQYLDMPVSGNVKQVNAGVYDVTLKVDDSNYTAIKSTQLIINKAQLTPEIPNNLTATYLDTVASVELPTADNGVWKWNVMEGSLVGNAGNNQFDAIFVYNELENCDNYIDYSTKLTIAVGKNVVDVPTLEQSTATYTGNEIKANISDTKLYKVTQNGWTDVEKYNVELTLNDSNNYKWNTTDSDKAYIPFEITIAKAVISNLTLNNWDYNATPNTPSATSNFGTPIFTYSDAEDGKYVDIIPTLAGTYYVKASVVGTNNYEATSEVIAFTINKKSITAPTITAKDYTGEKQTSGLVDNEIYKVSEDLGGTEFGEYSVRLTLNDFDNYCWLTSNTEDITITFIISSVVNYWESEQPELISWIYGTSPQIPEIKAKFGTTVVEFKTQLDDNCLTDIPENAGSYIARFSVTGDSYNYIEMIVPVLIEKATINVPTIPSKMYTGSCLQPDIQSNEQYTVLQYGECINVKDYTITLSATSNYKWETGSETLATATFSITIADNEILAITANNWIYNSIENKVSATASFGTPTYTYSDTEDGTYTTIIPNNVGTYYVKASVEGTSNYKSASLVKAFTIGKASIALPAIVSKPYNGSKQTATIEKLDQFEITTNEGGTNVNEEGYEVVLTITDANYKWETGDETTASLTFYITQADNSIELSMADWFYDGQPSTPSATATFGTPAYTYSSEENGTYADVQPTEGGTYYIKAEVVETTNYKGATSTVSFKIKQASNQITVLSLEGWTYGQDQNLPSATATYGTPIFTYSTSANGTYTNTQPIDAGTYYVKAEVAPTNNYVSANKTTSFVIAKANTEITNIEISDWSYSQTANNPTIQTNDFVKTEDITYYYRTIGQDRTNATSTVPTAAGSYYVYASVATSKNYVGCDSIDNDFEIAKATPQINSLPTFNTIYLNQTENGYIYSAVGMNDFKPTLNQCYTIAPVVSNYANQPIAGSWNCESVTYAHGTNASSYVFTFTPNDTSNYASITTADNVKANFTIKSVAHIGSTYYPTIESALSGAQTNDIIYVDPDVTGKVRINKNCTIDESVTLVLMYSTDTSTRRTNIEEDEATLYGGTYSNLSQLSCQTLVIVNQEVTITNNGTLEVLGELSGSQGGKDYAGHTAGKYAELRMSNDAKIISDGYIKCTGFIYEAVTNNGSRITINKGGIYMPFVLRDFKGGTYMKAVYDEIGSKETSPFNQYQFRNISTILKVKNNGEVHGYANLYAGSQQNDTAIKFVGTTQDFLIQFTNSLSYLEAKYTISTDVCKLDFYGGFTLNSMILEIKSLVTAKIDTSKVFFPINWAFDISLNNAEGQSNATFNLQQKLKMMPGSKITINSGVTATFGELNVYSSYSDTNTDPGGPLYPTKPAAKLIVNGTMICDSFGGNIYSTQNGATVTINTATTMTTKETTKALKKAGGLAGLFGSKVAEYKDVTNSTGFYYENNCQISAASTGTYTFTATKTEEDGTITIVNKWAKTA